MIETYAQEFKELLPLLAADQNLWTEIVTLVDCLPMPGKVTEGGACIKCLKMPGRAHDGEGLSPGAHGLCGEALSLDTLFSAQNLSRAAIPVSLDGTPGGPMPMPTARRA